MTLTKELSNEEVICEWMEPEGLSKPFDGPIEKHPYTWWSWFMCFPLGLHSEERRHIHIDLTLDLLYKVEERFIKEGELTWTTYTNELFRCSRGENLLPLENVIHASASKKIKAMAQTIRGHQK